jgi:hypothetical protein
MGEGRRDAATRLPEALLSSHSDSAGAPVQRKLAFAQISR